MTSVQITCAAHLGGRCITSKNMCNTQIPLPFLKSARARRFINLIPANIQGLSFARTPQMNINILTIGNPDGVGAFVPKARRRYI